MIIEDQGIKINLCGDPHLGRVFTSNVPLHRRGDRERMVWEDFEKSVLNPKAPLHICMGDLFHQWSVSYDTIRKAADTYLQAPDTTTYVILQGNHDRSRDLTRTSAFDLFTAIVSNRPNIHVVREALSLDGRLYLGWQPVETAEAFFKRNHTNEQVVFGHWDVDGNGPNLVPTGNMAARGVRDAFTGHVHLPTSFKRDGVMVTVVGSMQPYAHGEGDQMYVTVGLDDLLDSPELYKDKCVRVILRDGQSLEVPVDCLQLQVQRQQTEQPDLEVVYSEFNLEALFDQAFTKEAVPMDIRKEILGKYRDV